jgi:caffeoyl-CoA O-methyltransferase
VNRELQSIIQEHIEMAGLSEKIVTHVGDALDIIPTLNTNFDMVFIDAGKRDYALYYDNIIDRVNQNGVILADNVLWSGKVVDENKDNDTQIIDGFNKKVFNDPRVENITLPIRDGLTIAIKK